MTSTGDTLRSERLRRGWTLKQVAAETKISTHLLEALEEDRFDRLPYGLLTRNFARQYAHVLGLDEAATLASLKQQLEAVAPPPPEPKPRRKFMDIARMPPLKFRLPLRFRLKLNRTSLSAFIWLLLVVFACSKIYTVWRHGWETPANAIAVAPPPARPAAVQPAPPPLAPAPSPDLYLAADPTAATRSGTGAAAGIRLALTATEPVWVSIKSDGSPLFSGMLQAQQTRQFEGTNKMMVIVGNAGGLGVTVNDKPVGPIGPHGEIRLLELTPAGARIVARPAPRAPALPEENDR